MILSSLCLKQAWQDLPPLFSGDQWLLSCFSSSLLHTVSFTAPAFLQNMFCPWLHWVTLFIIKSGINCNRAFLAKYFHHGFPKQVWIGSVQSYNDCRSVLDLWTDVSLGLWNWKFEISCNSRYISAPLCAVQFCCGSAKMVTSLVTLLGHVGCLQLCLQLHWRGWCCSDFYSEMSSAAGKVHPGAVSIVCVCGLLICATSSSKINGLKNRFQWQSQEWLLDKGYFFHFLMMWLFSREENWWQKIEDHNKNTWKFKLSLLDMFHYFLYSENFRRVKILGFIIESLFLMKPSLNVWYFT